MDADITPVVLSQEMHRHLLDSVVLPEWTRGVACQDRPVVVFVAGHPGSGKTELADLVQASFNRRGGAVRICRDLYKAVHPHYADLLLKDCRTAGLAVRPDTCGWQAEVEAYVRTHGLDAVVETALSDVAEFRQASAAYRRVGSRIEILVLATAEALSQLGVVSRFLAEPRYVSWENHGACASGLLDTLDVTEAEQLADRITVVRRDGTVLYSNELAGGAWLRQPAAATAVAAEQVRPWTASETAMFRRELALTDRRLHRELSEGRCLTVQRDIERAAALAEPVRRTVQPLLQPPGVDYHRLSAEEHRGIFDELIAPSYLREITPRDTPTVVYVMGQPGAGKARAARLILRTLRDRPTHLVSDDFKASHPDYHQLLQDNPRGAGAAIRVDYRAWQAQAEAYVRAHRGDVVIEIAPGSTKQFLTSALPFRQTGYRIELVVLAVRAADSRQGTATRYAQALQLGVPARFTTAAGHDQCFTTVVDAVRAAEQHTLADSLVVMRRDGTAVYRNERGPDAGWTHPATAAQALTVERTRLYTPQEGYRFLAFQRGLRTVLPQHRSELDQISLLARPLLPAHLQPRRLPRPAPVEAKLDVRVLCSPHVGLSVGPLLPHRRLRGATWACGARAVATGGS
ncbi:MULTISPECIES: zeta toxin family protein [unclassified Streptomyces]|uniref:zeta toxin family protein n=1 Tax=unclassified Streptomyces TaxID=2593676 RepID=UPI0033C9EA61